MSADHDTIDSRPMTRPFAAILIAALALHAAAEEAWNECDCTALGSQPECDHFAEMCKQQREAEVTRALLIAAGEPRDWRVDADGMLLTTLEASSVDDALAQTAARLDHAACAARGLTEVRLWALCDLTDEIGERTISVRRDSAAQPAPRN